MFRLAKRVLLDSIQFFQAENPKRGELIWERILDGSKSTVDLYERLLWLHLESARSKCAAHVGVRFTVTWAKTEMQTKEKRRTYIP
jgi:hypothetical protein